MPTQIYINIDRKLVEESLLRILSELEPDPHSPDGQRDMRLKGLVDGLLSYIQAASPLLEQSLYPVPKARH